MTGVWRVEWSGESLRGPDGKWVAPAHEIPPSQLALTALDQWDLHLDLRRELPSLFGCELWWRIRYAAHVRLRFVLPLVEPLGQIAADTGEIGRIELVEPPSPLMLPLFRSLFPRAQIVQILGGGATGGKSQPLSERFEFWWLRARRACLTRLRFRKHRDGNDGRTKILFLSHERLWTGKEDAQLNTVLDGVRGLGYRPVLMATTFLNLAQCRKSIQTRPSDALFLDYLLFSHIIRRGIPRIPVDPPRKIEYTLNGCDLSALVRGVFRRIVEEQYREHLVMASEFPEVLRRLNVRGVVMIDENGSNHPLKCAAVRGGYPTIALQHGAIYDGHPGYTYPEWATPEEIPLCDKTCVYGDYYRRILTERSIYPDSHVAVTGQVQMDKRRVGEFDIVSRSAEAGKRRREILPPGCDRLLLLGSQGPGPVTGQMAHIALSAFRDSSKRHFLLVRPHPGEPDPARFWTEMFRRHGVEDRCRVELGGSLDEWLDVCDILISAFSTVLTEATLFGRPTILLSKRLFGDFEHRIPSGVAIDLEAFPSLDAAVDYWLEPGAGRQESFIGNRNRFIQDRFGRIDDRTGHRIAAVIDAAIKDRPRKP